MTDFIIRTAIYILAFGFSLYGMRAVRFEKILNVNKVTEVWVLWLMCAMALAYGVANFLLSLLLKL